MKTVLVVDDHPANLRLIRRLLTYEGYQTLTASDAESALRQLSASPPQLILMDLQLPGMDGLALTRRLKADPATQAIPIIALTASAMKGDEEKAIEAGCDGYVTKPIDTPALLALVAQHLRNPP